MVVAQTKIEYLKGDATNPIGSGYKVICQVVNDRGKFGKGFALAVAKKWPYVRESYLSWYRGDFEGIGVEYEPFELGRVQFLGVGSAAHRLEVANMVAQHGLIGKSNPVPLRHDALQKCLKSVAEYADNLKRWNSLRKKQYEVSVHMPKIGCGLGGSSWDKVEPIINEELCSKGLVVKVYEL